jgi:nucleoid-associated protein YgaU
VGKLEKVVVLTVLFLVAVILGVSLNADKGVAAALGPISSQREEAPAEKETVAKATRPKAERSRDSKPGPTEPAGLLSATIASGGGDEAKTSTEEPAEDPADQVEPEFILTLTGLEPSLSEDLMIYTWQSDDTFTSLADTYYGSRLHVSRLRGANEDRRERDLIAGDRILVPVLPPLETETAERGEEIAWGGGSTYTVQTGDVLGTISQAVYGTSKSWRKIFDANRDQLADANALTVGMVLRIPE